MKFLVVTLLALVFVFTVQYADAFTLEEIEELQAEQKMLQDDVAQIKVDLENNLAVIEESTIKREDIKGEIRLLKLAESDDVRIFAQEKVLSDETVNLRTLKLDRISLLDEQSQKLQRINSINDDVRYNVVDLDETKVEFVTSENINLQINIDELTKQLRIQDEIIVSIEQEIFDNDQLINQYQRISDKYQRELDAVSNESKTSWLAIEKLDGAKTIVASINNIVGVLKVHEVELETDKIRIIQERQTIETIIEVSTNKLIENEVDQVNKKRLVGLQLSNTCIILIKNNIDTDCPTYLDLINLDSSNTEISGEFITDEDTGFFHRGVSNYQQSWRWYDHDEDIRLIVDPPLGMSNTIKMITIENNFDVYFAAGDHSIAYNPINEDFIDAKIKALNSTTTTIKAVNGTSAIKIVNGTTDITEDFTQNILENQGDRSRKYHGNRHIDSCRTAIISAPVWETILTDTIEMLRTDCLKTTIQSAFVEHLPITNIDITTSPNWQYAQWVDAAKSNCKVICKEY